MSSKPFRTLLLAIIVLCGLVFVTLQAHAQAVPGAAAAAAAQSERIDREQQQRQQDDIDRSLENDRPPAQITVAPPPTPKGHGSGCRTIKHVVIQNADHMNAQRKREFAIPYEGYCLGVDEIQHLMGDITKYYIDRGYATTRVYLPSQDLTTGTLIIRVMEGKVSQVKAPGSVGVATAFPFAEGSVFNLRDYEQGLDQINRLLSNNATMEIEPGKDVGDSVIVIKNQPTERWHINGTADDYGDQTTGRNELGTTASYDDLLGLNEFYSITERKTVPFSHDTKQASSTSALFSIPFGYWTATAGYTGSNYDSTLVTPGGSVLHLNGDDQAGFLTIDNVLWRSKDSKLDLAGTLTRKNEDNYLAGQKLVVSSRTLTVADLGLNYSTVLLGGSTNASFDYARGLRLLGPEKDPADLPGDAPHAQYDKFTLNAGWMKPFKVYNQNVSFSTQFSGQHALNVLFGTEQFSIGGVYTVRGFNQELLANDDGYYLRNDLTVHEPVANILGRPAVLSPYIALDGGSVGSPKAAETPAGTLIGAAIGTGFTVGSALAFDIYGGHPVTAPKIINDTQGYNMFARLSVTF